MKTYNVTFIEGDGIGPEVSAAAKDCVDAIAEKHRFSINWDKQYAGASVLKKLGTALPEKTISSIRRNKIALKGPITTPIGSGFRSVNVALRQRLRLFANVRPAKALSAKYTKYPKTDLIVIRENTEDLYNGIEFEEGSADSKKLIKFANHALGKEIGYDSAIAFKTISKSSSKRIFEFAFCYARENKRKRITAVHKANILKYTDGLFIEAGESVARKNKRIRFDEMIVDDMCAHLVALPQAFDMLVCPNLYGDIISDLCAGLVGGLGLAPSANIGDNIAVFEPVHGSAPKHAGKNEVNPTASILSAAMMLQHMGESNAARELETAIVNVIKKGKSVTYDLKRKNPATTTEMTGAVIREIG